MIISWVRGLCTYIEEVAFNEATERQLFREDITKQSIIICRHFTTVKKGVYFLCVT